MWHYQQANNDLIKPVIEQFDWEKSFSNLEANKQVSIFNDAIMNNFEILLSMKQPLLMTKILPGGTNQLKHLLREKKAFYKRLKQRTLNFKLLDELDGFKA